MTEETKEQVPWDPSDMKPNSHVKKEHEKVVKSVVKSNVKKRDKSISEKFTSVFVSEDAGDVKSYLIFDILIPALKDTVADMIKSGIDAVLYGTDHPRNVKRDRTGTPRVSYQKYYESPSSRRGYSPEKTRRSGRYDRKANHDFRDVIFNDKRDAIAVLDGLVEMTAEYDYATVMDFNQLAGQDSNFTDNDFGWDDLRDARVLHVRGGYILDLPTPVAID